MPAALDLIPTDALIWLTLAAVTVAAPILGWWRGQAVSPPIHELYDDASRFADAAVEAWLLHEEEIA